MYYINKYNNEYFSNVDFSCVMFADCEPLNVKIHEFAWVALSDILGYFNMYFCGMFALPKIVKFVLLYVKMLPHCELALMWLLCGCIDAVHILWI